MTPPTNDLVEKTQVISFGLKTDHKILGLEKKNRFITFDNLATKFSDISITCLHSFGKTYFQIQSNLSIENLNEIKDRNASLVIKCEISIKEGFNKMKVGKFYILFYHKEKMSLHFLG